LQLDDTEVRVCRHLKINLPVLRKHHIALTAEAILRTMNRKHRQSSKYRHGTFDRSASRGEQAPLGLVATACAAGHAARRIQLTLADVRTFLFKRLNAHQQESSNWRRVRALLLSAARSEEVDVADVTIALEMAASMEEGPPKPESK
jgi:hypothetical protein